MKVTQYAELMDLRFIEVRVGDTPKNFRPRVLQKAKFMRVGWAYVRKPSWWQRLFGAKETVERSQSAYLCYNKHWGRIPDELLNERPYRSDEVYEINLAEIWVLCELERKCLLENFTSELSKNIDNAHRACLLFRSVPHFGQYMKTELKDANTRHK